MKIPDIHLLQAAIMLAEIRNYSRAAKKLGIQQPTLTKRILDLEHHLGVQLFDRSTQHVEPTDACLALVEEAKLSVFHAEKALHVARVAARGVRAVLQIGRSPYTDPYIASLITSLILPLHPNLEVLLLSMSSSELEAELMLGKLDLAVVEGALEHTKLTQVELARQPLYAVMDANSGIARERAISLHSLRDKRWIVPARHSQPAVHDNIMRTAQRENVVPSAFRNILTAEEAAQDLYTNSGDVAFLRPSEAWRIARHGLTMRPLTDESLSITSSLMARSSDSSRLVSEFTRTLKRKLEAAHWFQLNLPLGPVHVAP